MNNTIENRQELVQKYRILAQNFALEMAKKSLPEVKEQASVLLLLADSAEVRAEIAWLNELLEKTVNYYTSEARLECYRTASETSDPMKYACLTYTFKSIRVKETRDKVTRDTIREIAQCDKDIDLLDLHQWIKEHKNARGIGADPTWPRAAAGFNAALTRSNAVAIGDTETAKRFCDLSQYRKTNEIDFEAALGDGDWDAFVSVIHKMLGDEFEPNNEDWRTLTRTLISLKKKARNTVKSKNNESFVAALKDICYRILTDGHYTLESDLLKK